MDLNTHTLMQYPDLYIASRLDSVAPYRYGTGSAAVAMIATIAAGMRRASTRVEAWARGTTHEGAECGLPRAHSAR